jgi:hypothetical protein
MIVAQAKIASRSLRRKRLNTARIVKIHYDGGIEVHLHSAGCWKKQNQAEDIGADLGLARRVEQQGRTVIFGEPQLVLGVDGAYGQGHEADFGVLEALQINQRALGRNFKRHHSALGFKPGQSGRQEELAFRLALNLTEMAGLEYGADGGRGAPECGGGGTHGI